MTHPPVIEHAPAFGKRLCQALQYQGKPVSPVFVEREFNLRYRGNPVTPHAARKWLQGMSVPTQDKIHVLARWLDVDEDWLRWGPLDGREAPVPPSSSTLARAGEPESPPNRPNGPRHEEASLLQDWRLLLPQNQELVRTIMEVLLRQQREGAQPPALPTSIATEPHWR